MASLSPTPKLQFFSGGSPLVGGKLYTYAAGTTTPLATYTDSTGGTQNTNPVIMDARGEASVWLGTSLYYMELKDSTGALIWTADNVGGSATLSDLASTAISSGIALIGNAIQRIANIATLRTIAVTTSRDIETQGYYTAGDGGHGTYYGVTGAAAGAYVDNGCTVILPTGGDGSSAWLLKHDGVINFKQAGAQGNGASDSSAAFLAAINAFSTGGTLRLPSGTYNVDSVVSAASVSNIKIVGDPGAIIQITGATIHNAFSFTSCSRISIHGIRFEWNGVAVYSNAGAWESNYAIRCTSSLATSWASCHDVEVIDCEFDNCATILFERVSAAHETAVAADATKRYYNVRVKNNNFVGTLATDTPCIDGTFLDDFEIAGNDINAGSGSWAGMRCVGAGAVGGGLRYSSDGDIHDNLISTYSYAIYNGASDRVTVHHNILDMNGSSSEGIDFESCINWMADSNKIYNTGKPFSIFYEYSNGIIQNNEVELTAAAPYFIQFGASTATATGDLAIVDNKVRRLSAATSIALLQCSGVGGHIKIDRNHFEEIEFALDGTFYTQSIKDNKFLFTYDTVSTKLQLANATSGYAAPLVTVSGNEFLGIKAGIVTNVVVNMALLTNAATAIVENNRFTNVGVPLLIAGVTAAPSVKTIFRDCVLDNISYAYGPQGGVASDCKYMLFYGLTKPDGSDYFGTTANFNTLEGAYGCANGSRFLTAPMAAAGVYGYVNVAVDGSASWKAISTVAA